ncbi:MAG: CHASE2 domain-containing protein [Spirochaetota bacterium]|nr:CHASE2 domain-containing protein [Spirochaetota bacterium]
MIPKKKILKFPINVKYIIISIVIGSVLSYLHLSILTKRYENIFSDFLVRIMAEPNKISDKIVYTLTDNEDLYNAQKYYNMGWPWKRAIYAKLLRFLNLCGAKSIVFDSIFTEKSPYSEEDDKIFSSEINRSKNIIFAILFYKKKLDSNKIDYNLLKNLHLNVSDTKNKVSSYDYISLPINTLLKSINYIGFINAKMDFDNTIRRTKLLIKYNNMVFPSLGLATILQAFPNKKMELKNDKLYYNNKLVPLNDNGELRIKYYGDSNIYDAFDHMNMIRIYDYINKLHKLYIDLALNPPIDYNKLFKNTNYIKEIRKRLIPYKPDLANEIDEIMLTDTPVEAFSNKIILIGAIADALYDLKPTPFNPQEAGIHVRASVINNFLNEDFFYEYDNPILSIILILFFAVLSSVAVFKLSPLISFSYLIIILGLMIGLPFVFIKYNLIINTLTIAISIIITFLSITIFKRVDDIKDKIYVELVDRSPIGIMVHSDGQILLSNKSANNIFYINNPNLIEGKGLQDLLEPNLKDSFIQSMNKVQAGKINHLFIAEYKVNTQDPIDQHILTFSTNFSYKGRESIQTIIQDITEQKMFEQLERKLNLALDRKNEELEAINNELQSFAHIVSHDLKAPLRAISSLVNWISADYTDKLDDNGREQIQLLLDKTKHMHKLIDGVLQYSRAGGLKKDITKIDLNELLQETINLLSPPNNVNIKIENKLPIIQCEKIKISQVFQNLLSNAIKFMDKPKGEIKINCENNSDKWKISVSDNGPGIEEKYFDKMFQIFNKLNTRKDVDSTGVGLSIVKKIIEQYGGKIWVESTLGIGTTFNFTIKNNL